MADLMFIGPEGFLQGRYHDAGESRSVALVLHPHPLHGGTMNNRVTYTMYNAFAHLGSSVLRFNFRGVGRSQGRYDGGIGEISDAAAALEWLTAKHKPEEIWVAGYSFGAYVGMQLMMRRPEITGWVSVAPPINHYDFNFLQPCPPNGLIIHGNDDTLVPEPVVQKLVEKLNEKSGVSIDYRVIRGADHVFARHVDQVGHQVTDFCSSRKLEPGAKAQTLIAN